MQEITIRGVTKDGKKFRPSDWAERLYYAVAEYGPHRQITFNPFVKMKIKDDVNCIVVNLRLQEQHPMIFDFLTGFARDNDLLMLDPVRNPVTDS